MGDPRPDPPDESMPAGVQPYRHVPFDIDVEQALLGSVIASSINYYRLADVMMLRPDHFYDGLHGRIWKTIEHMLADDRAVTPLTLHAEMKADPGVIETGGQAYFEALRGAAPAIPNMRDYGNIVRDLAVRRRLITVGEDIVNRAYDQPEDGSVTDMADEAAEQLYETTHIEETGRGPEYLIEAVDRAIKMAEVAQSAPDRARILTGMPSVDKALGGLFPCEITFLGAAPSQGKSGLGAQIGLSAARHHFHDLPDNDPGQGYVTLVFSEEMSSEEWAMRYVAQEADVPANRIMEGRISAGEFERVVLTREKFLNLPYKIDGSTSLKVSQMRARAQAMKRKHGRLDLVIVDHLGFTAPANDRLDEKQQLKQITRDLKGIAKDLGCAMLVITHLNRDFWKRANQRPVVSDLYGSSAIEQNADHIWFIHREEYYLERNVPAATDQKAFDAWIVASEKAKGKAEIFSAKRRGGPVGTAIVNFDGPLVRFLDPDSAPLSTVGMPASAPSGDPIDLLDLAKRTGDET